MDTGHSKELRLKIPFFEASWTTDKGMSLFLGILLVVLFVVFPLAGIGVVGRFVVDLIFSAMLISGALANRHNRLLMIVVIMLTIGVLVVHWLSLYAFGTIHPLLDAAFVLGLFGCFVVIMLAEVFRPGAVTINRIQGAVAAYLSVGITWGYAYYLASLISPGAIYFSTPPTPSEIPEARYVYFSFMTLTSVGYGDILPVHPMTRAMAVSEALIGQLYPAILIAGVLAMALQSHFHNESVPKP